MTSLVTIEGIGAVYAQALQEKAGVRTVEALLEMGTTPQGRDELAETTGISRKLILEWVNLADLMRIHGIGEEYSDLLEEAGVDTVRELQHRVAKNLLQRMQEVNAEKNLVRRLPSLGMVQGWIDQAKQLPPKVMY